MVEQKFCPNCGAETRYGVPQGDNRERAICDQCDTVHYVNPKVVVGCIVERDDSILFCRRNITPQKNKWTLPAGYMENNESAFEGAERETMEESGAVIRILAPYRLFDLPHISQMYLIFRAKMLECPFLPTSESSEVKLFHKEDIPWDQIAFSVIRTTLEHYLVDSEKGTFTFENHVISRYIP